MGSSARTSFLFAKILVLLFLLVMVTSPQTTVRAAIHGGDREFETS